MRMQIPKRRSQSLKILEEKDNFLTADKVERLKKDLEDLEKRQHPQAVEDLSVALQKGDLSENAEYTESKARLARIDGRIFSIKERIKNAVIIEQDAGSSTEVRIGSTVLLSVNGTQREYQILGTQESDPSRGRISYRSPLGSALIGHATGESVDVQTENGIISYGIIEIK